jgi:3-isopropylmalate dehydrogenase
MVTNPAQFDVMVTTNMFGDIITDLGAVTQGGMGMAASGNINPVKTAPSMFEPVHGSAPDIAGENKANPLATFMSAKMMLDFLGEKDAADELDQAICSVSEEGYEGLGTKEIGEKVAAKL